MYSLRGGAQENNARLHAGFVVISYSPYLLLAHAKALDTSIDLRKFKFPCSWILQHIAQSQVVPLVLAVLPQPLSRHHDWDAALCDEVVAERAQKNSFQRGSAT